MMVMARQRQSKDAPYWLLQAAGEAYHAQGSTLDDDCQLERRQPTPPQRGKPL